MISILGESGFSVFQAGHCDWQRPHSVQVAKSSMPFQVKSSIDADAERGVLVEVVDVVEGDRLAVDHQRLDRAQRDRPAAEQHVERRHEDVQVLGVQHDDQERPASRRCAAAGRRPRASRGASCAQPVEQVADRLRDEGAVAVRQVARRPTGRRRGTGTSSR